MITASGKVRVYECLASTFWRDVNGIVYLRNKRSIKKNVEATRETIAVIKKIKTGEKKSVLTSLFNFSFLTLEIEDYAARGLPNFFKATAIVSSSTVGKNAWQLVPYLQDTIVPNNSI